MSMDSHTWHLRANAYVLRLLRVELSDLPYDWQEAYRQGKHWKKAAEEAMMAFQAEIAEALRPSFRLAVSPRMRIEPAESDEGILIWEEYDQGRERPVRVVPRDLGSLIGALIEAERHFTPRELGFGDAADAFGRRVAEAHARAGHVEGEVYSDYMSRVVEELRQLRTEAELPAEDIAMTVPEFLGGIDELMNSPEFMAEMRRKAALLRGAAKPAEDTPPDAD